MKKLTLSFALALTSLLLPALAKADDDFKVEGTVLVVGGIISSVDPTIFVISGCGDDNQKCSCQYSLSNQSLTMKGQGTSGTATGLDFTCNWQIFTSNGSCLIQWRVDIPYSGSNGTNFLTTSGCNVISGFEPHIPCSGHNFNINTAVRMDGQQSGGTPGNIDKGSCN